MSLIPSTSSSPSVQLRIPEVTVQRSLKSDVIRICVTTSFPVVWSTDGTAYRKVLSTRAVWTRLKMDLIQWGEWRWAFSRTSPSDRHGLTSFPAGAGRTMYEIRQLIHCTLKLAVTSGIVHMVHMCIKLSNPILAAQYVTNRLLVFCSASYSTRVSVRLYWYTILAFGIGLQ